MPSPGRASPYWSRTTAFFDVSKSTPRRDVAPWQQTEDWRRAITYLVSRPDIAADGIGPWGTTYVGGTLSYSAPPTAA
ncbi:hypothetical protein EASAB2608_06537 [Streptomyces sp. EAS-AB2608]|nr:hypothetical protein EASAB2608_06537 [Streptomyces sp. EAS-AB2608]